MIQEKRWDPEHYHPNSSIQSKHALALIAHHAFSENERILDIGCGDGKITAWLGRRVPRGTVLGIDKSPEMIAFAQRHFCPDESGNIAFQLQDALAIDDDRQFDLVTSFSCLHYAQADNQLRILRNIRQALRPDGKILLMLYRKCAAQWAALDEITHRKAWRPYFIDFTSDFYEYRPDSYQALLRQAGLGQFSATFTEPEDIQYESRAELSRFVKGWLPHIAKIPPERQNDFLDEVTATYLRNLGIGPDDPLRIPFVRLLVC